MRATKAPAGASLPAQSVPAPHVPVEAARTDVQDVAVEVEELTTRDRVRSLVVTEGPVDAARLATLLELTPAGVRRHLAALVANGEIIERDAPRGVRRGRGRPAREYVATTAAQGHLPDASAQLAIDALAYVRERAGEEGVEEFADRLVAERGERYLPRVEKAGGVVVDRADALARAFDDDGFAASIRRTPARTIVQLCQGHCPMAAVAARFPELCEAETRLIARLLGVHVQRLATIATGGHACTTAVPLLTPTVPAAPST